MYEYNYSNQLWELRGLWSIPSLPSLPGPLWPGEVALKSLSAFSKASASFEPHHHCLVSYQDTYCGVLPLCRASAGVFYNPADWQYTQLNVKTVLFQIIQFSISTQFKRQNSSISSNSVLHKYAVLMSKHFFFKQFSLALTRS